MFNKRSKQKEFMDSVSITDAELIENLHEIQITNRWFGSSHTLLSAFNKIYRKKRHELIAQTTKVVDLGCGNGDLLRVANQWFTTKKLKAKLLGVDVNAQTIKHARQISHGFPDIEFIQTNALADQHYRHNCDIITLNSICHHLTNTELVTLLTELKNQTRIAIIINDLQRHWLSYYGFKLVAILLNFSTISRHDGPISVLRGFKKQELIQLMKSSNITDFDLHWTFAFRWRLIIWCN